MSGAQRGRWLVVVVACALTALACLPVFYHWAAPPPRISRSNLALQLAYVLAAAICYRAYRVERHRLCRMHALVLVLLIFLLTSFINALHAYNVDQVTNYFPYATNEVWQEQLQNNVVNLVAGIAPHSYRFLPNGIVGWIEMGHVRFGTARDIYRLLSGLLLFYGIYRYARLYTAFRGAVAAMLLVAVVYPISFEHYAGQLTDPLSHLSFVLAFIFLETENFPFLLATLIGSLAKETVLALAGYYVIFCRGQRQYAIKAGVLCAASLAIYFAVRTAVLHGPIGYQQVSGVNADHILLNWHDPWPALFLIVACGYVPFLALCWKSTPLPLKRMYFYLLPTLFLSSLLFSWLVETRNYMPLVFVLSVAAARCLTDEAKISQLRQAD